MPPKKTPSADGRFQEKLRVDGRDRAFKRHLIHGSWGLLGLAKGEHIRTSLTATNTATNTATATSHTRNR